jgi:hypothetical protein
LSSQGRAVARADLLTPLQPPRHHRWKREKKQGPPPGAPPAATGEGEASPRAGELARSDSPPLAVFMHRSSRGQAWGGGGRARRGCSSCCAVGAPPQNTRSHRPAPLPPLAQADLSARPVCAPLVVAPLPGESSSIGPSPTPSSLAPPGRSSIASGEIAEGAAAAPALLAPLALLTPLALLAPPRTCRPPPTHL